LKQSNVKRTETNDDKVNKNKGQTKSPFEFLNIFGSKNPKSTNLTSTIFE